MISEVIFANKLNDAYCYIHRTVKLVIKQIESGKSQASDDVYKTLVDVIDRCEKLFPNDYIPMTVQEQWDDFMKRCEKEKSNP